MGLVSSFIFFIVLFLNLINEEIEAITKDQQVETSKCSGDETIRCRDDGPPIKFPFWLKGLQNDNCGYPGFQLSCYNQNETMLQLPYSTGNFLVKKIDYVYQALLLSDPHDCIISRLLQLNLSSSPFSRYESVPMLLRKYTLFNCSSTNTDPRMMLGDSKEINCLRVHGYQVYAVNTDADLDNLPLAYCTTGETFTFPNDRLTIKGNELDGAQVSDELVTQLKFNWQSDLLLRWNSPSCEICEKNGQGCRLKNNNNNNNINSTGLPLDSAECFNLPKPPSNHAKGIAIKVVAAGLPVCIVLLIAMIIARRHYRARYFDKLERTNQAKIEKFLEDYKSLKPTRYSYADIKRMTNQFQKKLGEGGYGSVFKGILSNEIPVAVKILNNAMGNGEEFINEVGTIGTIHHVNVVRLLGFCADGFKRALVYEFLPNESLEKFIFLRDSKNPFLGWTKLHEIAVGTAKGIEYLHQGCDQRILHFDIKPHNILLDYNFNPKISDFGLAKLCSKDNSVVSMTAARGTMGYIAPEVVSRNFGNVSYKSDVYSFGMMLLEMVGGRKNIDAGAEKSSQVYFPEWIYNRINQEEDLEIKVETEGDEKIAKKLTIVGLWCIQWYPIERPSMKTVVQMLEGETESLVVPPSPFASTKTEKKTTRNINDKPARQVLTVISEQNELE